MEVVDIDAVALSALWKLLTLMMCELALRWSLWYYNNIRRVNILMLQNGKQT